MKTATKRTESLEEIVFRHRNRSYGAYQLRRQYKRTVIVALIITLFISSAIITYPLVTAMYAKSEVIIDDERIISIEMDKPPEEKPDHAPPPPPPPETLQEKVKFTAPLVVEDTAVESDFGKQDLLAEKTNTEVPSEEPEMEFVEEKPQVIEQPKKAEIFTVVEENPTFPGGEAELYKFLGESIKYPEEAKELGIQGRVFVNFVVETDGSVSNTRVLRGIGGGCDEEAIRVIQNMPRWTPGKQRGIPVRVSFNLPIKFTLQ